ncbi:MAG TPA: KamA family radical SAM protein [Thermoleophilia bacterium]|nr:KamA family radical SAM protein [Thermoleophilia bacterium]
MTKVTAKKTSYVSRLSQVVNVPAEERAALEVVAARYAFRANTYYLGLIDWDDPEDPIRRIIIPSAEELGDWGRLDTSNEHCYTKVPGCEHKYEFTGLLLVNDLCGGYCRFCFRKRLFMHGNTEVQRDVGPGIEYIRQHPEINNVLLTGGDSLLLSTKHIDHILSELRAIEHVQIIRFGSKMPAFNPFRITDDPSLLEVLARHSLDDKKIYVMTHFNHPRELTPEAVKAVNLLQKAGVVTANQTPLLRGVNDDPEVLGELFNRLSYAGVPPYYVFVGRPTRGNRHFAVPVEEAFEIFERARMKCSGLAMRARLVMSHATGKIEIVGRTETETYFRYHRAADPTDKARFLVFPGNPEAYWFDDYVGALDDYAPTNPFACYELN